MVVPLTPTLSHQGRGGRGFSRSCFEFVLREPQDRLSTNGGVGLILSFTLRLSKGERPVRGLPDSSLSFLDCGLRRNDGRGAVTASLTRTKPPRMYYDVGVPLTPTFSRGESYSPLP